MTAVSPDAVGLRRVDQFDVAVVGCGMAGLAAAIRAAEAGASVVVLEMAPETIREYIEACDPDATLDPDVLDGNSATDLAPPKSNWAVPLDEPPLVGYPVTGGITFTFGGLAQTTDAEVLDTSDRPIPGLYAAGNATGGLFYGNYPGGIGLTNALVYGRIAGREAARE